MNDMLPLTAIKELLGLMEDIGITGIATDLARWASMAIVVFAAAACLIKGAKVAWAGAKVSAGVCKRALSGLCWVLIPKRTVLEPKPEPTLEVATQNILAHLADPLAMHDPLGKTPNLLEAGDIRVYITKEGGVTEIKTMEGYNIFPDLLERDKWAVRDAVNNTLQRVKERDRLARLAVVSPPIMPLVAAATTTTTTGAATNPHTPVITQTSPLRKLTS